MFSSLFRRAEVSVDNAIGDFFGRLLIALSFIVAAGFAAASISITVNRMYGAEVGNMILAGGFCLLGLIIAIVVRMRSRSVVSSATDAQATPVDEPEAASLFDNDALMSVVSTAAPILLPSLLRTVMKNWHILLAAAAGLYVVSKAEAPPNVQPAE